MPKRTFNLAMRSHSGLSVFTTTGKEILVREEELTAKVSIRLESEGSYEWSNQCMLVDKEIFVGGRRFTNTSGFNPKDLLRLMPLQTSCISLERLTGPDPAGLIELTTARFESDDREEYWLPIQLGGPPRPPDFAIKPISLHRLVLKYFSCEFTLLGIKGSKKPQTIRQLFGVMSEATLLSQDEKGRLEADIYFRIDPEFFLFHNRLRKRPLNEDGSKPTFRLSASEDSPEIECLPWMLSKVPMPVLWTEL